MTPVRSEMHPGRGASIVALFAGVWLFVSPWIYGMGSSPGSVNCWILGALIFICAAVRIGHPFSTGGSWVNTVLAIWTFASPWIFGYTYQGGPFLNSLCVGVVVFCASIISANAVPHGPQPTPRHM
jgi:hypothetical protein